MHDSNEHKSHFLSIYLSENGAFTINLKAGTEPEEKRFENKKEAINEMINVLNGLKDESKTP